MKVLIAGLGKLGSTVAYTLMLKLPVEKLILYDIKDLSGDIMDLENASFFNNIEVTTKVESVDYLIICAGTPRKNKDDDLYEANKKVFLDIYENLSDILDEKTTVIIMTNPVERITELARRTIPEDVKVVNPEEILLKMRKGKELGWDIVKTKGYSNFGPAMSVCKLIEDLEKQ